MPKEGGIGVEWGGGISVLSVTKHTENKKVIYLWFNHVVTRNSKEKCNFFFLSQSLVESLHATTNKRISWSSSTEDALEPRVPLSTVSRRYVRPLDANGCRFSAVRKVNKNCCLFVTINQDAIKMKLEF